MSAEFEGQISDMEQEISDLVRQNGDLLTEIRNLKLKQE